MLPENQQQRLRWQSLEVCANQTRQEPFANVAHTLETLAFEGIVASKELLVSNDRPKAATKPATCNVRGLQV